MDYEANSPPRWSRGQKVAIWGVLLVLLGGAWYLWSRHLDGHEADVVFAEKHGYGQGRYDAARELLGDVDALLSYSPYASDGSGDTEAESARAALEEVRLMLEEELAEYRVFDPDYMAPFERQ